MGHLMRRDDTHVTRKIIEMKVSGNARRRHKQV